MFEATRKFSAHSKEFWLLYCLFLDQQVRNHDCSHTVDKAIFIVPLPVACFFEGLEWLGATPVTQLGKSSFGRYERFPPIMVTSARKMSTALFLKTLYAEMKQFCRETRGYQMEYDYCRLFFISNVQNNI
jgi:hypothetical protein